MEYPLVTVFTLIYNTNPRYVIEAIESVRANNYPNLQHIIIDDCSPNPEPKRAVKQWIKDNNYLCEFYEHETNYGICKTLNHVLELTKGKYLFGCSDDLISSTKILSDVEILEKSETSCGAIYSDAYLIDENGNKLSGTFIEKIAEINKYPKESIFEDLVKRNFLPAMTVIWKTKVFDEIGNFDENLTYEDYDMSLRVFKKHEIVFNPNITAYYRIHHESLVGKLTNHDLQNSILFRKHAIDSKSCNTRWKHEVKCFLLHNQWTFIKPNFSLIASTGLGLIYFIKKTPSHRLREFLLRSVLALNLVKP